MRETSLFKPYIWSFVVGDENELAHQHAKRCKRRKGKANPLFIYGAGSMGKTHLLRAVQNYINSWRRRTCLCVQDADAFVDDYVNTVVKMPQETLQQSWVITIKTLMFLSSMMSKTGKAGTINFFFNIFNSLIDRGKQIIHLPIEPAQQYGLWRFYWCITSRMSGSIVIGIESPSYEMKLNLIRLLWSRAFKEILLFQRMICQEDIRPYIWKADKMIKY